jgi:preprotein translocase subunit SecD
MNTTNIKAATLTLILVLLASACSRTVPRGRSIALDPTKPQFTIAAGDLAAPAVLATNSAPSGANATIVIPLHFTPAKTEAFRTFTREHLNQQAQLVVGSTVVAEPFIGTEIADGHAEIAFSSAEEAETVRALLSKKR